MARKPSGKAKFAIGDQVVATRTGADYEPGDKAKVMAYKGITMDVQFDGDAATTVNLPVSHFDKAPAGRTPLEEPAGQQEGAANGQAQEEATDEPAGEPNGEDAGDGPGQAASQPAAGQDAPPPRRAELAEGQYFTRFDKGAPLEASKTWASYYARALKTSISVLDEAGQVVETFDFSHLADVETAPAQQRAPRGRKRIAPSPDAPLSEKDAKYFELATRDKGVQRSVLTQMNEGIVLNWKGVLESIGRKRGYSITTDKSGPSPVYRLVPASGAGVDA